MNTATEVPLLDRVTWRDPLRPDTLISRDRGLMARTYGSIFILGAIVAAAGLLISDATQGRTDVILLVAGIAVGLGIVCFLAYTRLPPAFFVALNLTGTALIATAASANAEGADAMFAVYYVWMAILAALFCGPRLAATLIAASVAAFAIVLESRDNEFTAYYVLTFAAVVATTGLIIGRLRDRVERLAVGMANDARTDSLTGLLNRRGFDERYALEINRTKRNGEPLAVVICDLDRFKSVNDLLGHAAGDEALERTGEAILSAVRAVDAVARLGGEEFAVILPGADADEAFRVAERIRLHLCEEFEGDAVPLTASCGIAVTGDLPDGEGWGLIRAADRAMYQAKSRGRNRTVAYGEGPDRRAPEPDPV
jgi:diguanylate cyclase (GGDEF)-like protein